MIQAALLLPAERRAAEERGSEGAEEGRDDQPTALLPSAAARRLGRFYTLSGLFLLAMYGVLLARNLGYLWIAMEATTLMSAPLVYYHRTRDSLEATWKYLMLCSVGIAFALFGTVLIFAASQAGGEGGGTLQLDRLVAAGAALNPRLLRLGFIFCLLGYGTKAGLFPLHNWLPDAHSEAPPAVSALLSAALLPSVAFVAWRVLVTLGPALDPGAGSAVFLGFGLLSLALAVPFLWRALPWKRLLAYSSLEHMGVLALGIGFATPLATAGVVAHVAGHALAKSLGFYAATPLLRHVPDANRQPIRGLAAAGPASATAVGVSLGALAALPPSPLFVSELLILLGGLSAGETAVTIIAAALLALGFLGLAHALIEGLVGEPRPHRWRPGRSARQITRLTVVCTAGMLVVTVLACLLPGSEPVELLMRGVG
jgi:hydrogenase-4 component F